MHELNKFESLEKRAKWMKEWDEARKVVKENLNGRVIRLVCANLEYSIEEIKNGVVK